MRIGVRGAAAGTLELVRAANGGKNQPNPLELHLDPVGVNERRNSIVGVSFLRAGSRMVTRYAIDAPLIGHAPELGWRLRRKRGRERVQAVHPRRAVPQVQPYQRRVAGLAATGFLRLAVSARLLARRERPAWPGRSPRARSDHRLSRLRCDRRVPARHSRLRPPSAARRPPAAPGAHAQTPQGKTLPGYLGFRQRPTFTGFPRRGARDAQ